MTLRFVPVQEQAAYLGPLLFAGRAELARAGGGVSGDGLWREAERTDGGTLFLLIDIEGKGPPTTPLYDIIDMALCDESAWDRTPGELLVELHSQGAAAWAASPRDKGKYFVAQALLVLPQQGHFLLASAGIPNPYFAPADGAWRALEAPHESIAILGWPAIPHGDGPAFPDARFELGDGGDYVACTDGIVDLGRKGGLRPADVLAVLNGCERGELEALLAKVFAAAAVCDGADWPGDDSTAVAWRA